MAEINNSLALGIKNDAPDIGKTLLTAGQINEMRAKTALEEASTAQTQQNVDYNQLLQDRGEGVRPGDANTLAATSQKRLEIQGQIGNVMSNAKTQADRQQAIDMAEKAAGKPIDPKVKEHLLTAPLPQFQQYGKNMQAGGQSSTTNVEQNPGQIYQRQQAAKAGDLQGNLTAPNGSGPPPAPGQPGAPATRSPPLVQQVETAKSRATQGVTNLDKYNKEGTSASIQSAALHQMQVDAGQVRLGSGAQSQEAARRVVTAIGEMVPSLKPYTDSASDKSAAFQSFDKNAGIVSRAITQEVGTQAASGLDMITKSLISSGNTNKGVDLIAPQLIGLSHFKQARAGAANKWSDDHGGDMTGFETDFNKKASVGAWMVKELPSEQQQIVGQYLKKNNPDAFNVMIKQLNNIREQKLDEGVF